MKYNSYYKNINIYINSFMLNFIEIPLYEYDTRNKILHMNCKNSVEVKSKGPKKKIGY